jgi:hypothetical protein
LYGLRDGVAGDEDAVVLQEHDLLVAHRSRETLAFAREIGRALVVVVVGDLVAVERSRLARRHDAVVLQHVERDGPRLVRVQHDARP